MSGGDVAADDLFGFGEDFIEGHRGGIEDDGVFGGAQGGFGAVAVAVVALFELAEDGFFGLPLLLGGGGGVAVRRLIVGQRHGGDLAEAAVAADFGGGVEEDLDLGVGG